MQLPPVLGCVQPASRLFHICWAHMKPASSAHVSEQPSPEMLLRSSHASPGSTRPSPQTAAHACVTPAAERQPGSGVHVLEQPVPSPKNVPFGPLQRAGKAVSLVPQSQASRPSITPLPHTAWEQTLGAPVHVAPGSTLQMLEQPSPAVVLPSSHCSPPTSMPSPQSGSQRRPSTRQT